MFKDNYEAWRSDIEGGGVSRQIAKENEAKEEKGEEGTRTC